MNNCGNGGVSKVYLINPKDIKRTTTENGVVNFELKRKYGKFKREVIVLDNE